MSLSQAIPMMFLIFFVMIAAGAVIIGLCTGALALYFSALLRWYATFCHGITRHVERFHDDLRSR